MQIWALAVVSSSKIITFPPEVRKLYNANQVHEIVMINAIAEILSRQFSFIFQFLRTYWERHHRVIYSVAEMFDDARVGEAVDDSVPRNSIM